MTNGTYIVHGTTGCTDSNLLSYCQVSGYARFVMTMREPVTAKAGSKVFACTMVHYCFSVLEIIALLYCSISRTDLTSFRYDDFLL